METQDEVKKLTGEIFALTGQKVDRDDPIVAAALIQSEIMKQNAAKIELQVGLLLNATEKLKEQIQQYADTSIKAQLDVAKVSLRQDLQNAIRDNFGSEIRQLITMLNNATSNTVHATDHYAQKNNNVAKNITLSLVSGLISAVCTIGFLYLTGVIK